MNGNGELTMNVDFPKKYHKSDKNGLKKETHYKTMANEHFPKRTKNQP